MQWHAVFSTKNLKASRYSSRGRERFRRYPDGLGQIIADEGSTPRNRSAPHRNTTNAKSGRTLTTAPVSSCNPARESRARNARRRATPAWASAGARRGGTPKSNPWCQSHATKPESGVHPVQWLVCKEKKRYSAAAKRRRGRTTIIRRIRIRRRKKIK